MVWRNGQVVRTRSSGEVSPIFALLKQPVPSGCYMKTPRYHWSFRTFAIFLFMFFFVLGIVVIETKGIFVLFCFCFCFFWLSVEVKRDGFVLFWRAFWVVERERELGRVRSLLI